MSPQLDLPFNKRVVYVHGVPDSLELPDTVGGKLMISTTNM